MNSTDAGTSSIFTWRPEAPAAHPLGRQQLETEEVKVNGVGGEHLAHAGGPKDGRKLRVEDPFAAELMALHPVEEQDRGSIGRKDVLDLGGTPPKAASLA